MLSLNGACSPRVSAFPPVPLQGSRVVLPPAFVCGQCGLNNSADSNFCRHCGAPRSASGRSVAATPSVSSSAYPSNAVEATSRAYSGQVNMRRMSDASNAWFSPRNSLPSAPASFTAAPMSVSVPASFSAAPMTFNACAQKIDLGILDERLERRPVDPFFYPTTVQPLTQIGFNLIDKTIPKQQKQGRDSLKLSRDESNLLSSSLPHLPATKFFDSFEENKLLQTHVDPLNQQILELQKAKSLASVINAQSFTKLRLHQEQKKHKDSPLSAQQLKDIADLGSPIFPSSPSCLSQVKDSPGDGPLVADGVHERARKGLQDEDLDSTIKAKEVGQTISATASTLRKPSWVNDAGTSRKSVAKKEAKQSLNKIADRADGFDAAPGPSQPDWSLQDSNFNGDGDDIAAMAARILAAHQDGITSQRSSPDMYVDALGNPIQPMRDLDDLPNIKDDESTELVSTRPEASLTVATSGPVVIQLASKGQNLDSRSRREMIPVTDTKRQSLAMAVNEKDNKRTSKVVEAPPVTVAVHEKAPSASRSTERSTKVQPPPITKVKGEASPRQPSTRRVGATASQQSGGATSSTAKASDNPPTKGKQESQRVEKTRQAVSRQKSDDEDQVVTALPEGISEELQAELEECLDTIKLFAAQCTRDEFQDLAKLTRPERIVQEVLEAVSILLGQPESKWDKLKMLLSKPQFFEKLQKLDFPKSVTKEQFKKLCEKLQNPEFDEELIKTRCVAVVPLAIWCRAIGVYLSKTKYTDGPDVRPVAGSGAAVSMRGYSDRRASTKIALSFSPDLNDLDEDELRHVSNLTVTKEGIGQIVFPGETDCTSLDFEKIVKIEIGEVLVYPQPDLKPEIGIGLNKAAVVTMYQCWPSEMVDPEDLESRDAYREKIRHMTEAKRARFIDYDCTTGIWQFSVDNF